LKDNLISVQKRYCQLFLKFGSGAFLCFFIFFAPAAPVIAQIGSAFFIFLVAVLAPLSNHLQEIEQQPPEQHAAEQYSELDSSLPVQDIILLNSQRQRSYPQIQSISSDAENKTIALSVCGNPLLLLPLAFWVNLPEKWRSSCQPVRAGPMSIS